MQELLKFELVRYFKKPFFYAVLLGLFVFGILAGFGSRLNAGAEIYKNSPFIINQLTGLFSLFGIFLASILSAQILFREKDANFSLILYSTPISKTNYLLSRFLTVFGLSFLLFTLFYIGFAVGKEMSDEGIGYGTFHISFYLQPLFLLVLPNIFLCSAIACCVGWLGKNKLLVYISGLFLYIFYIIGMMFSGSPMMGGGVLPPSPEAMDLSAKLDPFGVSAFFHQTLNWSVIQRNTELLSLTGNLLFNRLGVIAVSLIALGVAFKAFKFSAIEKRKRKEPIKLVEKRSTDLIYSTIQPRFNLSATFSKIFSLVKLDLIYVVKSIPFVLICLGLIFYLSMELYGRIDAGIRLPEYFATSGLMVTTIIRNFHGLCLIVLLFYANDLYWRSELSNFDLIENSSPLGESTKFFAKWITLSVIILIFSFLMILLGIVFQIIFNYPHIELNVYASIFLFNSLPLIISAGIILNLQKLINNRFVGLVISSIVMIATATSLSSNFHITHTLLLFQMPFNGFYSDFNGWGVYLGTFSLRLLFGFSITLCLAIIILQLKSRKINRSFGLTALGFMIIAIISGVYILQNYKYVDRNAQLASQEIYEKTYRKFQNIPQPTITDINTEIELFPEKNAYVVKGTYIIQNKSGEPIKEILLNFDDEITVQQIAFNVPLVNEIKDQSVNIATLKTPLQPDEKIKLNFSFSYDWSGFNGHRSFNAIIGNGSFMRISNYFPRLGYQTSNEIGDPEERKNRNLGKKTQTIPLEAPRKSVDDFINLEMRVSTSPDQKVIGVGELIKDWNDNDRNYFQYKTSSPIPFRFAVSSAKYEIKKAVHNGINIEVYYHSKHFENVEHLIENAKITLDYCENNFGKYQYSTIRFAEISSFTKGFGATAYPATIYIPEDMTFHINIEADSQQDIINELAGHELSHQWWGNAQIAPDFEREGAVLLTETLAMYSELMLVKKMYGTERVKELVAMHKDIYLKERGFRKEPPLYKMQHNDTYLSYSKGAVVMYELSELIGENKVNQALKNLLQKHAYPNPSPISTDLIEELYAVTDKTNHSKIDKLFKTVEE